MEGQINIKGGLPRARSERLGTRILDAKEREREASLDRR